MASYNGKVIMPDVKAYFQAGIDIKKKQVVRTGNNEVDLKRDIKQGIEIIDRQDAINSFKWFNLWPGLSAELIERVLYYRGQGALFYLEATEKFYFLPYTLGSKGIDEYGRFKNITPIPFNGVADDKVEPWIKGLEFDVLYDIMLEQPEYEDIRNKCILLHDYSIGISQTNIARVQINQPIIDVMSACIPYMRTALQNSTGVVGMRVPDQGAQQQASEANKSIENAALTGNKFVSIVSDLDFQEITSGTIQRSEEFLMAMQSLDNYRLSLHGLENGGLFQKKAHMLNAEQQMNTGTTSLIYTDRLLQRQNMCNIANSLYGTMTWCEPSEDESGADIDGDGYAIDTQDPITSDKEESENVPISE